MDFADYKFDNRIPVIAETEVLVVGAGPGGVSAAVMAARQGVKTMIVERYGCPGGMAVFGEVTPMMYNLHFGKSLDKPCYVDWCRRMHNYKTSDELAKGPLGGFAPKRVRPVKRRSGRLSYISLSIRKYSCSGPTEVRTHFTSSIAHPAWDDTKCLLIQCLHGTK